MIKWNKMIFLNLKLFKGQLGDLYTLKSLCEWKVKTVCGKRFLIICHEWREIVCLYFPKTKSGKGPTFQRTKMEKQSPHVLIFWVHLFVIDRLTNLLTCFSMKLSSGNCICCKDKEKNSFGREGKGRARVCKMLWLRKESVCVCVWGGMIHS